MAASDTALRDALRALASDATEDDIGAVLAAHVVSAGTSDAEHAPVLEEDLIRVAGLRGDLHTHTDLTDGIVSLAGMVARLRPAVTRTTRSPATRRTWSCSG